MQKNKTPGSTEPAVRQESGTGTRDINSKTIFHNQTLCAQFIRRLNIPLLKNIEPKDIEDVTELYRPYIGTEFEADTVKKICLKNTAPKNLKKDKKAVPLFLISLIEHKSSIDYDVSMQLLRYMVCIWTEYAKETGQKNPNSNKNKSFRYPPILPVVYYEGTKKWSADLHLKSRIFLSEIFDPYIPDFTYHLVRIHNYTNKELLSHNDGMSLLMLINKIQSPEDWESFLHLPQQKINAIVENSSPQVLEIIASTIWSLCMKMNLPKEEALEYVNKIKEGKMGYLFENMEKVDIQAERRKAKNAQEKRIAAEQKAALAEQKAASAQQQAVLAQQKAASAQQQAVLAEQKAASAQQQAIDSILSLCKELGGTKELAILKLQTQCGLDFSSANEKVSAYWNLQNSSIKSLQDKMETT